MNRQVSPGRVFAALLMRDVTVVRRELPYFLIRTALQPLLLVTVFGFLMPRMGIIGKDYTSIMLPGVLALSLTLSAVQATPKTAQAARRADETIRFR